MILEKIKEHKDAEKSSFMFKMVNRYFESNIPIKYWFIEMDDFKGDPSLKNYYNNIVSDLDSAFNRGETKCFVGSFGVGKTLTSVNILKKASLAGYSSLYVSLNDIISVTANNQESYYARKELLSVDFLVIDEFDSRHMGNEKASDFFGRVLEDILRGRTNNKLPLFLCSNSSSPMSAFNNSLKEGITSLMHYVELIPVLGSDFRKNEKSSNG
jgi:DNA replication protein DnaC